MKDKSWNQNLMFLAVTAIVTFIFFIHTLSSGIKAFDELAPFKEIYLPVCHSITEIFELISILGLHQHCESSNVLYSNISSLRCNPFGNLLQLFIQLIFQKNPFNYHLYALILHLLNTALVFLILNKVSQDFLKGSGKKTIQVLILMLSLLWSTHPVNVESVLLATNANIVLSNGFSLLAFYLYLTNSKSSLSNSICLFTVYFFALLLAEFHFMLPLIIFFYSLATGLTSGESNIKKSFLSIRPLLLAVIIYIILFSISSTKINFKTNFDLLLTFERIFWLSPQILVHYIKLLLFPIKLSIDQALLVRLGHSLFDPYALFCIGFIFSLLALSVLSFLRSKNRFPFLFIILFPFLLSLVPYSQILAPVYNLASERYLYFPSFILLFGISHLIFSAISKSTNSKLILPCVMVVLLLYSVRGYIRTLDWKDNISLYRASINATDNPLFKAHRYRGLIPDEKVLLQYPEREVNPKFQKLAFKNSKKALSYYKDKVNKFQSSTPLIIKFYGLDPETLLLKSAYILAQCDFNLNNNPKRVLGILTPYIKDPSELDSSISTFYASLLYHNGRKDEAVYILQNAYTKKPYSTRVILTLCDVLYAKYGDLKALEEYCLQAFKYFPYDSYVLYALANIYKLMNNHERCAYFSYIYGIRNHFPDALKTAYSEYILTNDRNGAEKAIKKIKLLENEKK